MIFVTVGSYLNIYTCTSAANWIDEIYLHVPVLLIGLMKSTYKVKVFHKY